MKNKGFSLVELIVVIAIMAILVGVAVPVYTSYIDKANKSKDEQLVDEIKHAMQIASVGGTWAQEYGITQNGTYIGAIVLKPNNGVAEVQQEAIVGTAIEDALIATFGADYASKLTLSYDGWKGTLSADNLSAFVGSNYYGNIPTLMTDIQSLTGALEGFLSEAQYATFLDGSFGTWLTKNNIDKTNMQAVSNAAILYVAKNATSVNKTEFVNAWKSSDVGKMIDTNSSTNISLISAIAAEYAKAEAVVNWMNCEKLRAEFSEASVNLGASSDPLEALSPLSELFISHINGATPCSACLTKSNRGNYYVEYVNDPTCEKDANAYLALLGQVVSSEDKILTNIENPNVYEDESLVSYVNNYVSIANVLNSLGASEGTVVIVFTLDANGTLKANAYPLDYVG